jgi:hypothetical protein
MLFFTFNNWLYLSIILSIIILLVFHFCVFFPRFQLFWSQLLPCNLEWCAETLIKLEQKLVNVLNVIYLLNCGLQLFSELIAAPLPIHVAHGL